VQGDDLFEQAFEIYADGYPENEFTGLPVAEQLMRAFGEEFQRYLSDEQSVDDTLEAAQEAWLQEF
jgi:multiple sugar transport system substrate-binding protein